MMRIHQGSTRWSAPRELPSILLLGLSCVLVGWVVADGQFTLLVAAALSCVVLWMGASLVVSRVFCEDVIFSAGFVLLAAGICLVSLNGIDLGHGLKPADPLFVVAVMLLVAAQTFAWRSLPGQGLLLSSLVLVLSGGLLGALAGADTQGNLLTLVRFSVSFALVPTMILLASRRRELLRILVASWLLSALINASVALIDAVAGGGVGPALTGLKFKDRYAGLTSHPNHLALVCVLALPFTLTLALRGVRPVFFSTVSVIYVLAINVSGSRAGLLVVALSIFVLLVLHERGRLFSLIGCLALVVVLPRISPEFGALARLAGGGAAAANAAASDTNRVELLSQTFHTIANHPLTGVGFTTVRYSHDIYLQLMLAGGPLVVAGFVLYGTRLATILRSRWASDPLAAGAGISVLSFFVIGLVQNALYDRYLYVPAGILLGCLSTHVALSSVAPEKARSSNEPVPRQSGGSRH